MNRLPHTCTKLFFYSLTVPKSKGSFRQTIYRRNIWVSDNAEIVVAYPVKLKLTLVLLHMLTCKPMECVHVLLCDQNGISIFIHKLYTVSMSIIQEVTIHCTCMVTREGTCNITKVKCNNYSNKSKM